MTAENAYPLSPDHYAENSRLASGKWAKIEVKQTGVQLITNSTLRNLGFANPEKVNVYGYGGRMLPEYLDEDMIDDLPPAFNKDCTRDSVLRSFHHIMEL